LSVHTFVASRIQYKYLTTEYFCREMRMTIVVIRLTIIITIITIGLTRLTIIISIITIRLTIVIIT